MGRSLGTSSTGASFTRLTAVDSSCLFLISGELSALREEIKQQREEMKLLLRPGHTPSHPADSCADILDYNNQAPSGFKIAMKGDSHIL